MNETGVMYRPKHTGALRADLTDGPPVLKRAKRGWDAGLKKFCREKAPSHNPACKQYHNRKQ